MKEIFKTIGTVARRALIFSANIFKESIITTAVISLVVSLITGTIISVINHAGENDR